jgi:transcription-repair coupling factor (superfamily II helicase)
VQGIYHIAQLLQKLIPNARIGIGHGQMKEEELEPVMIGFIKGEIDILLSTSIIENGIDIANANTLIVENADRFGLSQLYQLKGRVGRSDRQAYSYFLYQSSKELSDTAFQRLQALQEFGQLGAGYSLAFRDLQIRGAGELLGAKQSGSMASVGYELYSQLINEQVAMLKTAVDGVPSELLTEDQLEGPPDPLPTFDIAIDAFIPDDYIKDPSQRLYYYQQMMKVRSEESLGEVRSEIEDRYGHMPEPVSAAFHVLFLRIRGQKLGIDKLEAKGGRVAASFRGKHKMTPIALSNLSRMNREAYYTRDQLIWPYTGDALAGTDRMIEAVEIASEPVEA